MSAANSLCYFRPVVVAYVRRSGHCGAAISQAWCDLRAWMITHGLQIGGANACYGLLRGATDNLDRWSGSYDACIELPGEMEHVVSGSIATQTVVGGVHIVSGSLRSHRQLPAALSSIIGDPLIGHGLSVGLNRPAIITYAINSAGQSDKPRWGMTLNVPISWANDSLDRAA